MSRILLEVACPLLFTCLCILAPPAIAAQPGQPTLTIITHDRFAQSTSARIHITNDANKPVRHPTLPFWRDHFTSPGKASLTLRPGKYTIAIEKGPEYKRHSKTLTLIRDDPQTITVVLPRIVDMPKQNWYAADLHIHRPVSQIPVLIRAEDIHFAPVITWWNRNNPWNKTNLPPSPITRTKDHRLINIMTGEDERGGGALLYFNLNKPYPITRATREYPSSLTFAREAKAQNPNLWIDIEKPFWRDVPLWLSANIADSIGIAHNHMWRSGVLPNEAWGYPRDTKEFPPPLGNALWTQHIYYHLLNCGIRIPPSAGSASGVLPNPVGYNRVYVHIPEKLTQQSFFKNLKLGRCFVTNGPLIICRVGNHLPGHTFRNLKTAQKLTVNIRIHANQKLERLDLVVNGKVRLTHPIKSDAFVQTHTLQFNPPKSGWFLLRAHAPDKHTYRFASTGPFYVQPTNQAKRISRASADFFITWQTRRLNQLKKALKDHPDRNAVFSLHQKSLAYWQGLKRGANAN